MIERERGSPQERLDIHDPELAAQVLPPPVREPRLEHGVEPLCFGDVPVDRVRSVGCGSVGGVEWEGDGWGGIER